MSLSASFGFGLYLSGRLGDFRSRMPIFFFSNQTPTQIDTEWLALRSERAVIYYIPTGLTCFAYSVVKITLFQWSIRPLPTSTAYIPLSAVLALTRF